MGTVEEGLDPEDYTDPHPATVLTEADRAMAEAIERLIDNKTCPCYIKEVAPAWLAQVRQ